MSADARTPREFKGLPKFLIADDGDLRTFVIHCHYPRFIMEFVGNEGAPVFIDSKSGYIQSEVAAGRSDLTQSLARLMREAGDFFVEQTAGE